MLELAALLRFERQAGSGTGQQTWHANGLAGFIAIAVLACVNAFYGLLDFFEQFAFAVAGAQFKRMFFFDGGAVSRIGNDHGVFAQVFGGLTGVHQNAFFELNEFAAEVGHLHVVHVLVVRHGDDVFVNQLFKGLGFPVVGAFGIFFHSGRDRLQYR